MTEDFDGKQARFEQLWYGVVPATSTICEECDHEMSGRRLNCDGLVVRDVKDDKEEVCGSTQLRFEGLNRSKSLKFRQYLRNHVMQKFHKRKKDQWVSVNQGHYNHAFSSKDQFLTKENCRKYWMGEMQREIEVAESWI